LSGSALPDGKASATNPASERLGDNPRLPYSSRVDEAAREALELEVRRRCEAADLEGGAIAALRGYGPEVYGLLFSLHRDESDAADVFADFSECLWRGLPGFAWQCTLRTWAYTVARNASHRFLRGVRRGRRGVPLSEATEVERLAESVRTQTSPWLRTESKDRLTQIREALPPEDQMLLVLRIDRGLAWRELARVWHEGGEPDEAALEREAARLRKRFQLLREQLVEVARREGLLPKE
jgi:RNA polymerase sigma-70 factor (ECF subfamily)